MGSDLLIIALAPVVVIAFYVWSRDKYEREPLGKVLLAMFAGAVIVVPVIFIEELLMIPSAEMGQIVGAAWNAFVVAAFTEELFKFTALYLFIWKSPEFNDKYDGIVYATFVSLGFAAVENIGYVVSNDASVGLLRAFTAVPAHAIFGITMGFYLGIARFYPLTMVSNRRKALLIPMLLHGVYDFILMTGIAWLWVVFIGFVIFLYRLGLKQMKVLNRQSFFRTDYDLLNQKLDGNLEGNSKNQ